MADSILQPDFLRENYDGNDLVVMQQVAVLHSSMPARKAAIVIRQVLREHFDTEASFIQNCHFIATKTAGIRPLRWNKSQQKLYDVIQEMRRAQVPIRIIITKARQQGMSTFIQSWQYEQLDANQHRAALTVNYDDPNTEELFQKAVTIHDLMPCARETKRSSARVIQFASPHSSVFHVRTAGAIDVGRSLTLHHVHASEMPLWPDADLSFEALNQCVPSEPGTSVIKESTARGAQGHHYDAWNLAKDGRGGYTAFFSPWFWQDEYTMPFRSDDARRAFGQRVGNRDREYQERYGLSIEQMHWRAWKIHTDLKGSEQKFRQEYPACAEEAFLTTGSPVFEPDAIMRLTHGCAPPYWTGDLMLEGVGSGQSLASPGSEPGG